MSPPPVDYSERIVRWGMLVIGLSLMTFSFVLKVEPSLLPRSSSLIADSLAKVGLVFLTAWLAWPIVIRLQKAPGGFFVLLGMLFVVLLFIYRPKTIYITGPFISVAIILALITSVLRRTSKR